MCWGDAGFNVAAVFVDSKCDMPLLDAITMSAPIITLTTDFGTDSFYVAQMKAAILSIHPHVRIVDITHSVPPQNIRYAAWVLVDSCYLFPDDTIHLVVVDPGVGSERRILLARYAGHEFVCPDNGLLTGIANGRTAEFLFQVQNSTLWRSDVSATFHGRDIMGPVSAHRSCGLPPDEFGKPSREIVQITWSVPRVENGQLKGTVEQIDSLGNLISNLPSSLVETFRSRGSALVRLETLTGIPIVSHYQVASSGSTVALIGSHGRLEIAVVNGNAAHELGVELGDEVAVGYG